MPDPPVLITGAGPTGLLLAHELLRRQIPILIIDKRPSPSSTSRAFTIHARSMEMFDHMGIAARLEEVCLQCPGNIYHFPWLNEAECPRTDFRALQTRFAFYYKISQDQFEGVLREHLQGCYGVGVEFGREVVGVVQDQSWDGVRVVMGRRDGKLEEERYRYVVGCDGVHSTVRKEAGIQFEGRKMGVMGMMDVELQNVTFDDRWMNYFFNETLFMNCTKLPGKYWRIYMSEPESKYVHREDPRKSYQEAADELGMGIKVGTPAWVTAWSVPSYMATQYRNHRVIICGDACHVHSPAGGQGMNCCMQDSFNLGWKLAAVVKGHACEKILDSYEKERKPIGYQVNEGAMATHKIVMGFGVPLEDRYPLTQETDWEERTVNLVSGLSHNYCDVAVLPTGLTPVSGPRPGERAPDALLVKEPRKRLYDVYRRPQFTLLVAGGTNDRVVDAGMKARECLDARFPNQVSTYLISREHVPRFDFDHQCHDEEKEFVQRYDIPPEGRLVLVRPDLYVGMACKPEEWGFVGEYLEQWFDFPL
ncbi:pentachlorophenol monooxygenase [Aspergillus sclerotiicarbonarius CBS 121057]|uniref:Pentachlorophenol monooxygenase n=1 Tax=Aspergillus sclerotiicarbonarius (strain CBS 121057 / IBT 28362) TaxID=1448318 RepID=A0A319E3L2_ASPSB|nr:pentachlorophenol monooxygenase [Aspergillus sclerotiicarbonarius CBS 121057]